MSVKIKIRNKKGMKDMSAYHEKKFDWSSFIIGILMTGVALFIKIPMINKFSSDCNSFCIFGYC